MTRNPYRLLTNCLLSCLLTLGSGCAGRVPIETGTVTSTSAADAVRLAPEASVRLFAHALQLHEANRDPGIEDRHFTHGTLWDVLEGQLASSRLRTEVIGASTQGREIRAITFGSGPTTVLLWSQMHGDESTATMALVDLLGWMAAGDRDPVRDRIAGRLTVVMVPMLNPDGAERFQRRNALGIDVNRDARRLVTPEGQALKALRDRLQPDFGFNLHDQNAHTLAGRDGERVAIALLDPAYDRAGSYNEVRDRARSLTGLIAGVLATEIPGRVARYDDTFNPRAFGDLMQQWGTSTVLIESGVLPDDPQKQRLRAIDFAALITALDGIATGGYRKADPRAYEDLPYNTSFTHDLLIEGGYLVIPGRDPVRMDLAFTYSDPVAGEGLVLSEVGDLEGTWAHRVLEVPGAYLHAGQLLLTVTEEVGPWLFLGSPADLTIREGPGDYSPVLWVVTPEGVRPGPP